MALYAAGPSASVTEAKRKVCEAIKCVAHVLRNRPATCRKYYVHPALIEAYEQSSLFEMVDKATAQHGPHGLTRDEVAVLKIVAAYTPSLPKKSARLTVNNRTSCGRRR